MGRNLLLVLVGVLLIFSKTAGAVSYIGSATIGTAILHAGAVEAFQKKAGSIFTSVQMPGTGEGIRALLEGTASFAGVARPLKPEEKKQGLQGFKIGHDAIAVFVHATNSVGNLSRADLKGIFTGRITSWDEVGGKPISIAPTTEILLRKRATSETFRQMVMDGANYGRFKQVDLARDQLIQLAANPNGICVASIGLINSLPERVVRNIKVVSVDGIKPSKLNVKSGAYPISRPLLLVTKGRPAGDDKRFIHFILSSEGQKIVARNFVPVK